MTLTPSGTTGAITLTTSAAYWTSNHEGIIVRYKGKEVLTTTVSSSTVMNGTVRETLSGTTADTDWDEQVFSAAQGYPQVVLLDTRLWFFGSPGRPAGAYASKVNAFFNFDVGTGQGGGRVAGGRGVDDKRAFSARPDPLCVQGQDTGRRRWRGRKFVLKAGQRPGRPLHFDLHACWRVAHKAAEPEAGGQAIDVWPEAHALDKTLHLDTQPCVLPVARARQGVARGAFYASPESHCSQASNPSPVRADSSMQVMCGFTARASCRQRPGSKST